MRVHYRKQTCFLLWPDKASKMLEGEFAHDETTIGSINYKVILTYRQAGS